MKLNKLKVVFTVLVLIMLSPSVASAASIAHTGDLLPQATSCKIELRVNGKKVNSASDMGKMFLQRTERPICPLECFNRAWVTD